MAVHSELCISILYSLKWLGGTIICSTSPSYSIQPLRGLSHSVIVFQNTQSHISMVLFVDDESTVLANVAF